MDRFPNARRSDPDRRDERWPDGGSVLADIGLRSGESVAVVGRAAGSVTIEVAEMVAPAPVHVVDVDGILLDEIDADVLGWGVENVTTISGDVRSIASLLPDPVDVVLIASAFNEADTLTAVAEQASRALRPGGRFVVGNWDATPRGSVRAFEEPPDGPRMTPEETRSVVATAGFAAVDEADVPTYLRGLVFEREHDR